MTEVELINYIANKLNCTYESENNGFYLFGHHMSDVIIEICCEYIEQNLNLFWSSYGRY